MKYLIIGAVVILGVFLVVLSQIPLGIEPLTEVYFENHTELPKYIFLDRDYNFTFTVHNLEYQDIKYNYEINAFDENGSLMFGINSGEFELANNESFSSFEDFSVDDNFGRAKIVIDINKTFIGEEPEFKKKLWWPDPNYPLQIDIHFWVDEIVGPKIEFIP